MSLLVDSNNGNGNKKIPDSTRVVYSYGSTAVTLSEVIDAVAGASARWPEISAENLIAEIKNTVLPALLMSANARQRGVDESEEFLSWKRGRSEDLLHLF